MKKLYLCFLTLLLFLTSCTLNQVNVLLWSAKQFRDGKITLYDINNDNTLDLVVSGYQKGGQVDLKKVLWIESDLKSLESVNGKWDERGYSFYLDKEYKLWVKIDGKIERVPNNYFRSNVSATVTEKGKIELLYNGKRFTVDKEWKIPGLKIWLDDGNRLWVHEGDNKIIPPLGKWKRKLNVVVNPTGEWIKGTGYKRGGKVDFDMVPVGDCVVAFNGKSQTPFWIFQAEDTIDNYPTIYQDKVYVGSNDRNFYAINLKTGKMSWRFITNGSIQTTAAITQDTILFGNKDGYLYALSSDTGRLLWSFKANGAIDTSPAVYEDTVFFGSWDKSFYALNIHTGKIIWKQEMPSYIGKSSPIVYEDKVIFGTWDRNVYALNIETGRAEWIFKTDDWIDKASPAAGLGLIYIGNKKGNVYALNANTGVMKWQFSTGDAITSSPVVTKNRVYITSRDGYLYAVSPKNGDLIWEHRTRFKIFGSPAVGKNKIYISSIGGYLYAISDTGMGRPYWPMFGGEPTHKGNFEYGYSYSKKLIATKTELDKLLEENGLKKKN